MASSSSSSGSWLERVVDRGVFANQGRRWTIVGILVVGVAVYFLIGGAASDGGCGESPPYLSEDGPFCFVVGYDGPMNDQNLLPLLNAPLDEATELAEEQGWSVYVKRRDDGLAPDEVGDDDVPDRLGVELDDGRVVRIWPG